MSSNHTIYESRFSNTASRNSTKSNQAKPNGIANILNLILLIKHFTRECDFVMKFFLVGPQSARGKMSCVQNTNLCVFVVW